MMKKVLFLCTLMCSPITAFAETIVAARNIRHHSIISLADLKRTDIDSQHSSLTIEDLVGMEARVVLYAGRPIHPNDVGPPALVERNQIVTLAYQIGTLAIFAEGRSLGRGSVGDRIRIMNLASRSTVTGWVQPDGSVTVSNPQIQTN